MDFNTYTERARGFVQSAQALAIREGHQRFLPEHLLKVLLDDPEGMASNLIKAAGGNAKAAMQANELLLAKQPKVEGAGAGQLYLSPEVAKLFESAEKVAKKAGDSFVTVERLLLALAMSTSEAGKALKDAGVTAQALNTSIESIRKGRTAESASAEDSYEALKKYTRDLTEVARDGKLDPVIGRDEEIRRHIQVLSRRTKNNPVLIGEPGVGKTAIVEGLALSASSTATCRKGLKDKRLAGARHGSADRRRQVPRRVRRAAERRCWQGDSGIAKGEIILFIDELHTLVGAGQEPTAAMDAVEHAQAGLLARGELHCVGATTLDEYRKHIEKDAALSPALSAGLHRPAQRRGHHLDPARPEGEATRCTTACGSPTAGLGRRGGRCRTATSPDRFLPDKAIDLVDEAAARLRMEIDSHARRDRRSSIAAIMSARDRARGAQEGDRRGSKAAPREAGEGTRRISSRNSPIR